MRNGKNILITGGAGFVGSNLAASFRNSDPGCRIVVVDNLKRRGSELNLWMFKGRNIEFHHGDIRNREDLENIEGNYDVLIECSAEPSVLAGLNGSPDYLLRTNLVGTLNCLEFARRRTNGFLFLSTSKVYSIEPLRQIPRTEGETRFEIASDWQQPGWTPRGITEEFTTSSARSLYGATKLASEQIIQEYAYAYHLPCLINRCGVIAGPGQFGKVDQGVYTLWVANHFFGKRLTYIGWGGKGKQVRDILYIGDLYDLLVKQMDRLDKHSGEFFNVGGGLSNTVSLRELTGICRELTGKEVPIGQDFTTASVDVPVYYTDYAKVGGAFDWAPRRKPREILSETLAWIRANEEQLKSIFA